LDDSGLHVVRWWRKLFGIGGCALKYGGSILQLGNIESINKKLTPLGDGIILPLVHLT